MSTIENPRLRVVEDLKIRNRDNMDVAAGEYFGSSFTFAETFQMFEDFKRGFLQVDGAGDGVITISCPSTIASVNSFYGAIDANKIANLMGPGFLNAYPDKFIREHGSRTAVVFDGFLSDDLIEKLRAVGVKTLIVTGVTDYMPPQVRQMGVKMNLFPAEDFLDGYAKRHSGLPQGMEMLRLQEFAELGHGIKEGRDFPYEEGRIAAYFLTGGTTNRLPKCVKLYADGLVKMSRIYDELWFDSNHGDRNEVLIPLFYATGAIHSVHAGLFCGMTQIYQPKYDRFAFGKDLVEGRPKIVLVAPSHVATLDEAGLADGALRHVKYVFIGGEAIMPAQMKKFRRMAQRLGIQYILNGYGMTETGSMSGISDKYCKSEDDVSVRPVPGAQYRIVDPATGEELPDGVRGILEMQSPCVMAGYFDESLDRERFTPDGWIHTGDVAMRYADGSYRIFGRETDCFTHGGVTYPMYDIEERTLEHPAVAEAEVIKFAGEDGERPAIVVVLKSDWTERRAEVLRDLCAMDVPGMEHLLGVRFVERFKTNAITAKRDYLFLAEVKEGYYRFEGGAALQQDVGGAPRRISEEDIQIAAE